MTAWTLVISTLAAGAAWLLAGPVSGGLLTLTPTARTTSSSAPAVGGGYIRKASGPGTAAPTEIKLVLLTARGDVGFLLDTNAALADKTYSHTTPPADDHFYLGGGHMNAAASAPVVWVDEKATISGFAKGWASVYAYEAGSPGPIFSSSNEAMADIPYTVGPTFFRVPQKRSSTRAAGTRTWTGPSVSTTSENRVGFTMDVKNAVWVSARASASSTLHAIAR